MNGSEGFDTDVLIVGASLAGLRTAEALRGRGYDGSITLIGAEPGLPYDRPPLSKDFLAPEHTGEAPLLLDAEAFGALEVQLRAGTRATAVDLRRRRVSLSDDEVTYGRLVIATGADARTMPPCAGVAGIHTLRTLADAEAIRGAFDDRPKVVVLGGGFIGAEVAAAARRRGLDVDLVELLPAPMSAALGKQVGDLLGAMHRDNGVRLRCGVTVSEVIGDGRVQKLVLSDGTVLDADLVIMGLGVIPAVSWLDGAGLQVDNGVLCDGNLRAIGFDDVYAVGDVARWTHPLFEQPLRIEHWTNANEHADVVASTMLGEPRVASSVPYVWSDQYGHKIQIVGRPAASDEVSVIEDAADGRHVAVYARCGRVSGLLAIDSPRSMLKGRKAIMSGASPADLLASL